MSLEHEVKQQKFASEFEKVAVNILFTGSWLHNMNAVRLKKFGLTPEQYNVLRILRGSHPKPLMLSEITCRMLDRSSNATRLVEKLRVKGLVSREICENNRRQVDIVIDEKGLHVLSRIDKQSDEWLAILKSITRAEAKELNRLLDKLRQQIV
jgi:DNA-binding MarR family transcriptional regulator